MISAPSHSSFSLQIGRYSPRFRRLVFENRTRVRGSIWLSQYWRLKTLNSRCKERFVPSSSTWSTREFMVLAIANGRVLPLIFPERIIYGVSPRLFVVRPQTKADVVLDAIMLFSKRFKSLCLRIQTSEHDRIPQTIFGYQNALSILSPRSNTCLHHKICWRYVFFQQIHPWIARNSDDWLDAHDSTFARMPFPNLSQLMTAP